MSRIGRNPVKVPAGVSVDIADGNLITVKGPKGTLTQQFRSELAIELKDGEIIVSRPNDEKFNRSIHGLTRTLINNMVVGVSEGYQKKLEIVGVGYRVAKQGKQLQLSLGFSHGITFEDGNGITFEVPDANTILVCGIDKQLVGQVAANIRAKRPPEPYKGKGIRYSGEYVRRKAGKTGK